MGSCAAPSAKGDDKFITTDYLQQCHFDDYLLPAEKFAALKREQALPTAINPNSDQYTEERLQLLDEQLATVTRGQGQRAARCHPHRVRAENHPAGCGGAGSGAGADRPNQPVTAAHQDHRTADGRGRLDGLQPPLHPLEGRAEAKDRTLLLSAILGDAINLG
ncbi:hypothetical protein ECZU20_54430 [Escherichia coli]|nr:hypothetical protein ECZU20_54430 [Escherichia coli]